MEMQSDIALMSIIRYKNAEENTKGWVYPTGFPTEMSMKVLENLQRAYVVTWDGIRSTIKGLWNYKKVGDRLV